VQSSVSTVVRVEQHDEETAEWCNHQILSAGSAHLEAAVMVEPMTDCLASADEQLCLVVLTLWFKADPNLF